MIFSLDGLTVAFPYPYIYPEQYSYMLSIKRALDARGHACLEMPTGTGKTISLLSVITAYQAANPAVGKLVYCTRTVPEMEKVLAELKGLHEYRQKELLHPQAAAAARPRDAGPGTAAAAGGAAVVERPAPGAHDILALGLSSRKNMCIHERVSDGGNRESVDAQCRNLTAPWRRARAAASADGASGQGAGAHGASASGASGGPAGEDGAGDVDVETCSFFENYEQYGAEQLMEPGVYTLADLRAYGRRRHYCPYFLVRHMLTYANVIVYNYQYMLDPKVSQLISRQLEKEAIVVFDEAHNIDSICIEALSVNIRNQTLDGASRNLTKLTNEIDKVKEKDARRLQQEYERLRNGLMASGALPAAAAGAPSAPGAAAGGQTVGQILADDLGLAGQNPVARIPEQIVREAIPGNIRRAEHFVQFLRKFVRHLRDRLDTQQVQKESPAAFLAQAAERCSIDAKSLRFCHDRLTSLIKTLEITNADDFAGVHLVADLATLVGTFSQGNQFAIILEPYDERNPSVPDPVLQLACLDAGLAIKPVFEKYQSVIITSGTLSPIDLYPRLLSFRPVVQNSFDMSLSRACIRPMVVTRGSDQQPISTKFEMRDDATVVKNYGRLVCDLAGAVPDGLVCFFVSYRYMDSIISMWDEQGVLRELSERKLIFVESTDVVETTLALKNYRRACDCGRGAVFFSIARGKVAEGIDFDRHYGRAVVMFGVPYQYTLSRVLRARLEYLRETFEIQENDFLSFDAIRQASQCLGRTIRSKTDWSIMVLADKRFNRKDKKDKLPGWITSHLHDSYLNLSTDMALDITREFMRAMAQPVTDTGLGRSLLSVEHLKAIFGGRVDHPRVEV